MKLIQQLHNGELWWFATFERYRSFGIGRVWKMPTIEHAMRIVDQWKLRVIDGRPYYAYKGYWRAYGS